MDPTPQDAGSVDPYARLGVPHDAAFDEVQAARQARLDEVGDDVMARSRIEAAYDAVLMDRLKERQQGRVSSAARTASQREQAPPPTLRPALPARPQLPQLPGARLPVSARSLPRLSLASGNQLWLPLAADGVLAVLMLALPTAPPELILALATGVTVLNLQRRHGRFLQAVGWSFALLTLGLILGALLAPGLPSGLPLDTLQLQSLPALVLLLLGALLIA
ncbi:CPP1-like family protein [Cyanobium sp. FGCU-6]|nr:CPP1-like family protein [Cyanobium sp. FGCU6]